MTIFIKFSQLYEMIGPKNVSASCSIVQRRDFIYFRDSVSGVTALLKHSYKSGLAPEMDARGHSGFMCLVKMSNTTIVKASMTAIL